MRPRTRIVPLEIFIARKLGMGFLGGLSIGPGIFLGFDFCPIQSSLSLEIRSTPLGLSYVLMDLL